MLIECACAVCHGPIYYPATGIDGRGRGQNGTSPATCGDNCRSVWHHRVLRGKRISGRRYGNLRVTNEYRRQLSADINTLARWMEAHGIRPDDREAREVEWDRLRLTWCRKYRTATLAALSRHGARPRRVGNVVDLATAIKALVPAHGF